MLGRGALQRFRQPGEVREVGIGDLRLMRCSFRGWVAVQSSTAVTRNPVSVSPIAGEHAEDVDGARVQTDFFARFT